MSNVSPYPIDAELTAVSETYANKRKDMIAERVATPVMVGTQKFDHSTFSSEQHFTAPDDLAGRKSVVPEVEEFGEIVTDTIDEHALDDFVPTGDMLNFKGGRQRNQQSPLAKATIFTTNLILLNEEKAAANTVFASANYDTGLRVTNSGDSQWSDFTNSTPIDQILAALDSDDLLVRPNKMVIGQKAYTKLRQHPKVAAAIYKNGTETGVVTRQAIADLFELDEVIVGSYLQNTAQKGQTPSMSRIWGKHCALIHDDPSGMPNGMGVSTFGCFKWYDLEVVQFDDEKRGAQGGTTVRVRKAYKFKSIAKNSGYFIQNAVA